MKSLQESLFSDDLVLKDIFTDPGFKKWVNRPDVLWYLFYYWASGEQDSLGDHMRSDWEKYKPLVDVCLDQITARGHQLHIWPAIQFNYDSYEFYLGDQNTDFADDDDFTECIDYAIHEISHKKITSYDGIDKTWFKGSFPKNSAVTELVTKSKAEMKPGTIDGGIFLTNQDTVIVLTFPKGIDKSILKLFNIIK